MGGAIAPPPPWLRYCQGRPQGHILKSLALVLKVKSLALASKVKSLALASKVKSLALASKPQVFENCPVLGSRTAQFFELLKFCRSLKKFI